MQYCHGKRSIQKEKESFHQQIGLKFKEEYSKMLYIAVACFLPGRAKDL
jgi:hypothetical protein